MALDGVIKNQWDNCINKSEPETEMQKLLVKTKSQIERLMINDVFSFQVVNPPEKKNKGDSLKISNKFSTPQLKSLSGSGLSFNFSQNSFKEIESLVKNKKIFTKKKITKKKEFIC